MPIATSAPFIGPPEPPVFCSSSPFMQSYLKVWRAQRHTHEVSVIWHQACDTNDGGLHLERSSDVQTLNISLPMPAQIPLATGDALRCLRSSLDYLVCQLARKAKIPDNNIVFPFAERRRDIELKFENKFFKQGQKQGKRAAAINEVYKVFPVLKGLILDQVQPYSAQDGASLSGDALWRIITSDNIDKHRLIIPTMLLARTGRFAVGGATFTNSLIGNGAIAWGGEAPLDLDTDGSTSVDLFFPEDSRLAQRPVIKTLNEGCTLVRNTIDLFHNAFGAE